MVQMATNHMILAAIMPAMNPERFFYAYFFSTRSTTRQVRRPGAALLIARAARPKRKLLRSDLMGALLRGIRGFPCVVLLPLQGRDVSDELGGIANIEAYFFADPVLVLVRSHRIHAFHTLQ